MYLYNVKWSAQTAGPSPCNNERTELFLLGCHKAISGNPCPGCFNSQIWHVPKEAHISSAQEVATHLIKHSSRFLTIGGGEPLDQIEELTEVCHLLKPYHFNIIVYTWRTIKELLAGNGDIKPQAVLDLISYIDAFIDGPFIMQERVYREDLNDGFLNSIGSANQHIVLIHSQHIIQHQVGDVTAFTCDETGLKINAIKEGEIIYEFDKH